MALRRQGFTHGRDSKIVFVILRFAKNQPTSVDIGVILN